MDIEELETNVTNIIQALDRIVANPGLSLSPVVCCVGKSKAIESILLSLGFRSKGADQYFFYTGDKSQATLSELSVASKVLASFKVTAREYLTAQRHAHLKPEPPQGAAGTVAVTVIVTTEEENSIVMRRNFAADDCLSDLTAWLLVILPPTVSISSLIAISGNEPPLSLKDAQQGSTLQHLGFWPSVRIEQDGQPCKSKGAGAVNLKSSQRKQRSKPSEIFKSISQRFDDDHQQQTPPRSRLDAAAKRSRRAIRFSLSPTVAPAPA
mmetsp:Transcript_11943/g.17891  ORF Transcript_11943/g.17891 Transcript_11943/m.17891 type:complete len:267 (-) Transcript_11943:1495-2295(-)